MTRPDVSIVVEWDNVRLAGASRARAMLGRLREEVEQDARTIEVLLVHDERPGDVGEAEQILVSTGTTVRALRAPGAGYYELKNVGAREATGELVVFLDCDVIPEPGWLREILAPFAHPEVDVVAGATYLDPDRLAGKFLAHTFVFPPRSRGGAVGRTDRFFANNVAFRRKTAVAFPFPHVAGSSRVSCVALADRLSRAHAVVIANPTARVGHPAPAGVRQTAKRAFVHGRDTVILADVGIGPAATVGAGMRRVGRLLRSVVRDRRDVGLPRLATPLALAAACAYYGIVAAGAAFTRLAPVAARRLEL